MPQVRCGWQITASPGLTEVTPEPTSSTQPAFSWPMMNGSRWPSWSMMSFQTPSMMCRSVRQSPAAPTFTITSSGFMMVGSRTFSILRSTAIAASYS